MVIQDVGFFASSKSGDGSLGALFASVHRLLRTKIPPDDPALVLSLADNPGPSALSQTLSVSNGSLPNGLVSSHLFFAIARLPDSLSDLPCIDDHRRTSETYDAIGHLLR